MPRVSRIKLSPEIEKAIKDAFIDELIKTVDKKTMSSLMVRLLTESETIMLAKRLMAFLMIDRHVPDIQISKSLHLTRETVARFRLIYIASVDRHEPVVEVVKKMQSKVEMKTLLKKLLLDYVLPTALGRIPRWGI